jgi:hypothetical protein
VGEHPTPGLSNSARYLTGRLLRFRLTCPRRYKQRSCAGALELRLRASGKGPTLGSRRYRIRKKRKKTLTFRLSQGEAGALARARSVRVVATARDARGRIKRTNKPYRLRRGRAGKRPAILIRAPRKRR